MRKSLIAFCGLLVAALSGLEAPAQDRSPDWNEDLEFIAGRLPELHVELFRFQTREDFDARVQELRSSIDEMSDAQAAMSLQALVASVGDGHTSLVVDPAGLRYYPFNMKWFDDGVFVTIADRNLSKLTGAKLVSVGGVETAEILDRLKSLIPHDNEYGFRNTIDNQLNTADYLQFAGASDNSESAEFVFEKDGEQFSVSIDSRPVSDFAQIQWHTIGELPLCFNKSNLNFWNDWIADEGTVYFKYNSCTDARGFGSLVQGTSGFVSQNRVQKFVLDLRHNGGGNSAIFAPLFEYLSNHPQLNERGKLFVIVGRGTFSSGLWAAYDMKNTNAVFIGEPTGGKPNHFGEVRTVQLPSSGFTLNYSTREWIFLENEDPDSLEPDVRVEYLSSDYFAGKDAALRAVFDFNRRE